MEIRSNTGRMSTGVDQSPQPVTLDPVERQRAIAAVIRDASLKEPEKRARIKEITTGRTLGASTDGEFPAVEKLPPPTALNPVEKQKAVADVFKDASLSATEKREREKEIMTGRSRSRDAEIRTSAVSTTWGAGPGEKAALIVPKPPPPEDTSSLGGAIAPNPPPPDPTINLPPDDPPVSSLTPPTFMTPVERQRAIAAVIRDASLKGPEKRAKIKEITSGKASGALATGESEKKVRAVASDSRATLIAPKPPPPGHASSSFAAIAPKPPPPEVPSSLGVAIASKPPPEEFQPTAVAATRPGFTAVSGLDERINRKASGSGQQTRPQRGNYSSVPTSDGQSGGLSMGGVERGGRAEVIRGIDSRIAAKAGGGGSYGNAQANAFAVGKAGNIDNIDERIALKQGATSGAVIPGFKSVSNSDESARTITKKQRGGGGPSGVPRQKPFSVDNLDDRIARKQADAGIPSRKPGSPPHPMEGPSKVASAAPATPRVGAFSETKSYDPARRKDGWVDDNIFDPRAEIRHDNPETAEELSDDEDRKISGDGPMLGKAGFLSEGDGLSYEEMEQKNILRASGTEIGVGGGFDGGKQVSQRVTDPGVVPKGVSLLSGSTRVAQTTEWSDTGDKNWVHPSRRGGNRWNFTGRSEQRSGTNVVDFDVAMANPDLVAQDESWWDEIDRSQLCVGAVICLIVVCAISVPVVLVTRPPPPPEPTSSPTNFRSTQYAPIFSFLNATASSAITMLEEGSPQQRALDWIKYEDPMGLWADSPNLLQRYVLMVVYYSAGGDQGDWMMTNGEWGTDAHECEWEKVICEGTGCRDGEWRNRRHAQDTIKDGMEVLNMDVECQGVVTGLDLRQAVLIGTLATEIGALTSLSEY